MFGWRKWIDWVDHRLDRRAITALIRGFGLPATDRRSAVLGMLIIILLIMQIVTGLLLAFYYHPAPRAAYASTLLIIRDTHFGWYIHQMHVWGSHLLIVLFAVHVLGLFVYGAYRGRGEIVWITGVGLVLLSMQGALTGNLLPWDQQAYWSTVRTLEIIRAIPLWGTVLSFLVGGLAITPALLIRFYVVHTIFIPFLLWACIYLHAAALRRLGYGARTDTPYGTMPALQALIRGLLVFGIVLTLGTLFPTRFIEEADPFTTPSDIRLPWFLWPAYGVLETLTHRIGGWVLFLVLLVLLLFPFADRTRQPQPPGKSVTWGVLGAVVIALITFGYIGYIRGG